MSKQPILPTTHVIFDFIGTICDIRGFLAYELDQVAARYGKVLPTSFKEVFINSVHTLDMNNSEDMLEEFFSILGVKEPGIKYKDLFTNELLVGIKKGGLNMIDGVDRLIRHLSEHNIPMAIATNMSEKEYKLTVRSMKSFQESLFSHHVCGADDKEVITNKPAPDIYLVCAKRFQTAPKDPINCVIFEDSIIGITGAVNSGMKTVLINNKTIETYDQIEHKITVSVGSYNDFKPESVGLPPYQKQ